MHTRTHNTHVHTVTHTHVHTVTHAHWIFPGGRGDWRQVLNMWISFPGGTARVYRL